MQTADVPCKCVVTVADARWLDFKRLLENYCFVLLTNRAPPQISDNRPDMRHRALFVTSRAVRLQVLH